MLGESKMQISDAKELVQTLTLSKVQQEQLTDGDAAREDQEWAWFLASMSTNCRSHKIPDKKAKYMKKYQNKLFSIEQCWITFKVLNF